MARAKQLCLLAVAACAEELLVPLPQGGSVGLSTRGPSAFRLRLLPKGQQAPLDTPMVLPDEADAAFEKVATAEQTGIKAAFGSLVVLKSGALQLADQSGAVLTTTDVPGGHDACAARVGADIGGGVRVAAPITAADEGACCAACTAAKGCTNWIFASGGEELGSDSSDSANCWLVANITGIHTAGGRTLGGQGITSNGLSFSSNNGLLYGRGGGRSDGTKLTSKFVTPFVDNLITYVPHYYSTDGYAALGVVAQTTGNGKTNNFPASYSSSGHKVTWSYQGPFELYLMPAATLDLGTEAYYSLVGAPRVPPLYAFGFIASRWGWTDRHYIEDTLGTFRSGKYPVDAFIGDFEWFTNESDYDFQPPGKSYYHDFGYNPVTFPEPAVQLAKYRKELKVRMGGIRKPRLGGTTELNYARSKGWLLPGDELATDRLGSTSSSGYAHARNVNFSIPEAREWYAAQTKHYEEEGVSFFWNDEGETDYFTFYWWNVAQSMALKQSDPDRRFYSLNRAFSPGMARLGATVWTGDVNPAWGDLQNTAGMILNWGLAGAPYVACDIGGFTGQSQADLLTRWYQLGTFMPTMRVHSTLSATPHFPWLWGEPHASVMRAALELRYRLIPYHYSLAHAMFTTRRLWMRPLAAEFPTDAKAVPVASQWLDGGLLVAPVLTQDSQKNVYLPAGTWYAFGTTATTQGPAQISGHAELSEVPVFARPGTLVTLAPLVQSTQDLPGGPLEVQVYAGADGAFELVEDDGETLAYEKGSVRVTKLSWDDVSRTLSWTVAGAEVSAPTAFKQLFVSLFAAGHQGPQRSAVAALGQSGSVTVPKAGTELVFA